MAEGENVVRVARGVGVVFLDLEIGLMIELSNPSRTYVASRTVELIALGWNGA